jgi:hypothetical protein
LRLHHPAVIAVSSGRLVAVSLVAIATQSKELAASLVAAAPLITVVPLLRLLLVAVTAPASSA